MKNNIKKYSQFLNEDVNTDVVEAKLKITELKEKIQIEVKNQNDAESIDDKAKFIDAQASLYQQMPALLKDLSAKMQAKASSGDQSNIY